MRNRKMMASKLDKIKKKRYEFNLCMDLILIVALVFVLVVHSRKKRFNINS